MGKEKKTMYKIIKITGSEVLVGNTEDNSLKRVQIENSYEGALIGDEVDLFSDGQTNFITFHQTKVKFDVKKTVIKTDRPVSDEPGIVASLVKLAERGLDLCKKKQTYIGLAVYLGILLVGSIIVSAMFNASIKDLLMKNFGSSADYLDMSTFSLSPVILLGSAMMGAIKLAVTDNGLLGSGTDLSIGLKMTMPVILLTLVLVGGAIVALKKFIQYQDKEINKAVLFERVLVTVLIGQVTLTILFAFFSQNITDFVRLSIDIVPFLFQGTLLVLILTLVFGTNRNVEIQLPAIVKTGILYVKQKFVIFFLVGTLTAILIFMVTNWDAFVLIGNYGFWFPIVSFGGQILTKSAENSASLFKDVADSVKFLLFVMMAVNVVVLIIDLDEIQAKFAQYNKYVFAAAYSGVMVVFAGLLAMLAGFSGSASFYGTASSYSIGVDMSSLVIAYIVMAAASGIRLSLNTEVPILETIRTQYHRLLTFLHI